MALDLTNAATLSGLVNQNLPMKPWLARKFFGVKLHDTLQIGVDIIAGSRKLAPFRKVGQESTVVNSDAVVTKWFGPNQISLKVATTAFDMAKRAAGMQISYADGMKTIEERTSFKLAQDQLKLTNMIWRAIEKMCADALFTDTVNNYAADGSLIESFSMGVSSDHKITLTGTDLWSNAASDPLTNIDMWANLVGYDSGLPVSDVVLGKNAAKALRGNEKALKQMSVNTSLFAALNPQKPEEGAQFLGYTSSGIRIWFCNESYANSQGVRTSMVPDDYALVISDQLEANIHYGMIEDRKAGNFVGEIFSKTWEEEDPSVQWLKCASAPLSIVEQPDGLLYAKVV